MIRARRNGRRAGYTLLELAISTVLLGTVGYSISLGVKMGQESHATVMRVSSESRAARKSLSTLVEDVRASSDSRITVTTDGNGNSQVRLLQPIEVGGAMVWGVRDRRLGEDEDAWNQENWSVNYAVDAQDRLVRTIVDDVGATRFEDALADDLGNDGVGSPGFRVARSGDIWQVNIVTRHGVHDEGISESEFHVRTRN